MKECGTKWLTVCYTIFSSCVLAQYSGLRVKFLKITGNNIVHLDKKDSGKLLTMGKEEIIQNRCEQCILWNAEQHVKDANKSRCHDFGK